MSRTDSSLQTLPDNPQETNFLSGLETLRTEARVTVHCLNETAIDPEAIAAWNELESHSGSSTPFLSRAFVESAINASISRYAPVYLVIKQGSQWIGLGVFESVPISRSVPIPHLRSWRTNHTFLDGFLLRSGFEQAALEAFWEYMQHGVHPWYAVNFRQLAQDDPHCLALDLSAQKAGVDFLKGTVQTRAALHFSQEEHHPEAISKRRTRSLRQSWNWLSKHGEVNFQLQNNKQLMKQSAKKFLELEALGWKSECGTALKSKEKEREFFLDFVEKMSAQNRVFFLELSIDEKVIGSVVHFVAGDVSYAFKLGWDPAYSRGCPGYQLKAQTLFQAKNLFSGFRQIDSCACPGSFIEHLWAGRREITSRVYLTSRVAGLACLILNQVKKIRDRGCQLLQKPEELADEHS